MLAADRMNVLLDRRRPAIDPIDRRAERRIAYAELIPWAERGFVMERCGGSVFHELAEHGALWMTVGPGAPAWLHFDDNDQAALQLFVVQHDWAAAFKGAQDFETGDFALPFQKCLFEFKVSGRRVCAYVGDKEKNGRKVIQVFVKTEKCWATPISDFTLVDGLWKPSFDDPTTSFAALPPFVAAHIRAICISLEAEIARTELVERSEKLNRSRARRGKWPLPHYHVIHLRKQQDRQRSEPGEEMGILKRLHFRRGHWRHLAPERKVWVKWCLAGNPELGFIDKQYRL